MSASVSKLELLARVVLEPALWDAHADAWARLIPHDFPGSHAENLLDLVTRGAAQLCRLVTPSGCVGFVVFDVEESKGCPPELVILAASGRDGTDLTEAMGPAFERIGAKHGCRTIRFHTMRPGLIKKARSLGYRVSEVIMRRDLPATV